MPMFTAYASTLHTFCLYLPLWRGFHSAPDLFRAPEQRRVPVCGRVNVRGFDSPFDGRDDLVVTGGCGMSL